MNMKLSIFYLAVGSLLCSGHTALNDMRREMDVLYVVDAGPALGAVMGKLIRIGPDGREYPASGIRVTLNHQKLGRSAPAYSDTYGFYIFDPVPAGRYMLEVWLRPDVPLQFWIDVHPSTPKVKYTSIPPIRVP